MKASLQHDGQQLRLQGELDFVSGVTLQAELARAIAASAGQSLTLDFAAVIHSNSVGLSLLLCAARSAAQHQVSLQVVSLPQGLLSMAGVCGLDGWLDTLTADAFSTRGITDATQ